MTSQEFARKRNWSLHQLSGGSTNVDVEILTEEEQATYKEIKLLISKLKDNWDENSIALGIELKPYKCYWCGKRSNKQHIYGNYNFCLKHFKEANLPPGENRRVATPGY